MNKYCLLVFLAAPILFASDTAITIYNQDFAVVRDTLPINLGVGSNQITFSGATAKLEPDSVILRDIAGKTNLQILEQSYRNDPVSEPMLLSFFEGKSLDFIRQEANKPDQTIPAKIIRSGYVPGGASVDPIVEIDGKLQFSLPGKPTFPSLGEENILKPALFWKINSSAAAKVDAEVAYVTNGFSWQASYNLIATEKGELVDFVGWITMQNNSGASFQNAKIKLMAGEVNKVQEPRADMVRAFAMKSQMAMDEPPMVSEKAFDEFHLYSLANLTTLRDMETKQVEFLRATGVKAERIYLYDGAALGGWRVGISAGADPSYGATSNKKINVYREFENSERNQLGIPLPKGRVRFYSQDGDRQLEFVGENTIEHTAKGERVRLYIGNSFDLVGERKRIDFKINESNHVFDESFEIKLRNRKKEAVEIRVVEHLFRWANWSIEEKSQDFNKTDAQTIEFRVSLKPDEEKTVSYKVRYTW